MSRYKIKWTPELIDELWTLYSQGLTSYQMAAHFGATRNSICGKLYRERVKRGIVIEKPRTNRIRNRSKRKAMNVPIPPVPLPPLALVPDESRLASIIDTTGCRWPVRDDASFVGGVAFCNHDKKDGSSYCAYHARVSRAASRALVYETTKSVLYLLKKGAA